jgi:hypothetical protein
MKNDKVSINSDKLQKLIDYIYESEAKHFEEYCDNGGKKENHIYFTALELDAEAAQN